MDRVPITNRALNSNHGSALPALSPTAVGLGRNPPPPLGGGGFGVGAGNLGGLGAMGNAPVAGRRASKQPTVNDAGNGLGLGGVSGLPALGGVVGAAPVLGGRHAGNQGSRGNGRGYGF